jgi:hypothetical protein
VSATLPEVAGLLGVDLSTPGGLHKVLPIVKALVDTYIAERPVTADERQDIRNVVDRMSPQEIAAHFKLAPKTVAREITMLRAEQAARKAAIP